MIFPRQLVVATNRKILAIMCAKIGILCFALILITEGFPMEKADMTLPKFDANFLEPILESLQKLKSSIDQNLAKVVGDVSVKQIQPVMQVLGDASQRVSKAIDDLTATKKKAKTDDFDFKR